MAVDGAKPLIIAQKEGRLYMEHEKTYIAPGTVFEGTVRATGDVQVDGEVIGEISSEGKVSVHKMGDVLAITGTVLPVTTSDVHLEAEFEKLPLERDLPILRNIIYEGIKMSGKKCKTGEKK